MPIGRDQLESLIFASFDLGEPTITLLSQPGEKPIRIASSTSGEVDIFRIYAWNVTHGGASRSPDEFRIQITSTVPVAVPGEQTLIVGWSEQFEVFAAWDPTVHLGRTSTSPSLQVHRNVLEAAYDRGLAAETRGSGDVAVAFRPALIGAYARVAGSMHAENSATLATEINEIPDTPPGPPPTRTRTARVVETYYRAWDFSARVLDAYDHACAICGLQLGLVEAAHIVPVAAKNSTDETRNGLALCRTHHRAYDALLIDVAPDLTVKVSFSQLAQLKLLGRSEGESSLTALDGRLLVNIPADTKSQPYGPYLRDGALARNWQP